MEEKFLAYLEKDIDINYNANGVNWVNNLLNNSEELTAHVDCLLDKFNEDNDTNLTLAEIEDSTGTFDVYTFYMDRLTIYEE